MIFSFYFIPIGNLKGKGFFKTKDNLPEHWQLLSTCFRHNIKWAYKITHENPPPEMGALKVWALRKIIKYLGNKIEKYLKLMDDGINPIEHNRKNKNN